jgi:hypothetical protein
VPSIRVRKDHLAIGLKLLSAALLAVVACVSLRDTHISAQDFPAVIGRIEGDDLEVATTTPSGVERDASPTVVASGSDVTLRSGHALLMLNAGGEISVCGPAHFKLIQSSGSVTLALDYGRVHPSLESSNEFSIYTPANGRDVRARLARRVARRTAIRRAEHDRAAGRVGQPLRRAGFLAKRRRFGVLVRLPTRASRRAFARRDGLRFARRAVRGHWTAGFSYGADSEEN